MVIMILYFCVGLGSWWKILCTSFCSRSFLFCLLYKWQFAGCSILDWKCVSFWTCSMFFHSFLTCRGLMRFQLLILLGSSEGNLVFPCAHFRIFSLCFVFLFGWKFDYNVSLGRLFLIMPIHSVCFSILGYPFISPH